HAVPLEGLHDALLRGDLPEAAFETVGLVAFVFDEAPVPALAELPAFDVEFVAAAPPARELLDAAVGGPHPVQRGVEFAFDVQFAVRGGGDDRVLGVGTHDSGSVRRRNSSRRSIRASSICR